MEGQERIINLFLALCCPWEVPNMIPFSNFAAYTPAQTQPARLLHGVYDQRLTYNNAMLRR